jgi:glycosyltransferase involved in cell wall biosynthesis
MKRPRLLIVVNVSWFFVMHRLPVAIMARERGMDVHVACGEGPGAEDIVANGFPFHPVSITRDAFAPLRDLRAIWSLIRLYKKVKPDIVHHVTLKPIVYGSIAARVARVPGVLNAFAGLGYVFTGSSVRSRLRQRAILRLLRWSLRLPNQRVVCENHDDYALLTQAGVVSTENAEVMGGVGVDTAIFHPSREPDRIVRVVLAARMLREKGVEYFVAAARGLKSRGVSAEFVLVGIPDPQNPGSLSERQLEDWNSEGVVEWYGFRDDMATVLADAHIVCLPTYYREGVPRVLIEAAACARPVVTTDMPGCRDIVRHGVNGLLVPPHDVDGLADALEKLIRDRDLRDQFGRAGRRVAEEYFSLDRVMGRMWAAYSGLASPQEGAR